MAPRNVDKETANNVLRESLGFTGDDLGMDRDDPFADLDLGTDDDDLPGDRIEDDNEPLDRDNLPGSDRQEPGDDQQRQQPPKKDEKKPDDLSVTHTPKDEFDHGKPKFDKAGNILGSKGQIIANKGREARMYQTLHTTKERLNSTIQNANTQIQAERGKLEKAVEIGIQVAQQLSAIREVGQLHTKAGLDDNDLRQAIEFASAFKKDQLGGLKMILTRAAANGIDLTQLGLQPGGFDTKSLLDMVREEINKVAAPIQQRTQNETTQQQQQRANDEAVQAATLELNQFLTAEPDAREYLPVIQEVMKQPFGAKMSLGEIWTRIQLNLLRNARENPGGQQQRSPNRQQQPRLPNGQGNPPDSGGGRVDLNELAPVTDSYEDILRGVLKAVG